MKFLRNFRRSFYGNLPYSRLPKSEKEIRCLLHVPKSHQFKPLILFRWSAQTTKPTQRSQKLSAKGTSQRSLTASTASRTGSASSGRRLSTVRRQTRQDLSQSPVRIRPRLSESIPARAGLRSAKMLTSSSGTRTT